AARPREYRRRRAYSFFAVRSIVRSRYMRGAGRRLPAPAWPSLAPVAAGRSARGTAAGRSVAAALPCGQAAVREHLETERARGGRRLDETDLHGIAQPVGRAAALSDQ